MSLQAVINPLEFMKKRTGFDGSRSLGEVTRERTNTPLKPGMLDYEAVMKKREGMKTMEDEKKRLNRMATMIKFRQGMQDRANLFNEMKERTGMRTMEVRDQNPGIPNMGGFDPGDLMAAPKLRQDATMNQANMVSSPYFEANEKAAEKTNPMNAASQEPGRSFLMKYIGK